MKTLWYLFIIRSLSKSLQKQKSAEGEYALLLYYSRLTTPPSKVLKNE